MKSYVIIDSSNLIYSALFVCTTKSGYASKQDLMAYYLRRFTEITMFNNKLIQPTEDVKYIFAFDGFNSCETKNTILKTITGRGYKENRDSHKSTLESTVVDEFSATGKKTAGKLDFSGGKKALITAAEDSLSGYYTTITIDGWEADDTIASVAQYILDTKADAKVLIVSSDRDILQLSDNTRVYQYNHIQKKLLDLDYLRSAMHLNSFKYIEFYKTFVGDSSDNIILDFIRIKNRLKISELIKILEQLDTDDDLVLDSVIEEVKEKINPDLNPVQVKAINSIIKLNRHLDINSIKPFLDASTSTEETQEFSVENMFI